MVEYRGDLKWQREAFGLKCHWGAAEICHVCNAVKGGAVLNRYLDEFDMFSHVVF